MGHLPPLKFSLNDSVQFRIANDILTGVIEFADFAHSPRRAYHSYSIFVEERGCSFTHVPEYDVLEKN